MTYNAGPLVSSIPQEYSTVGYPNPEDPEVFQYAEKLGIEKKADLLIASHYQLSFISSEILYSSICSLKFRIWCENIKCKKSAASSFSYEEARL